MLLDDKAALLLSLHLSFGLCGSVELSFLPIGPQVRNGFPANLARSRLRQGYGAPFTRGARQDRRFGGWPRPRQSLRRRSGKCVTIRRKLLPECQDGREKVSAVLDPLQNVLSLKQQAPRVFCSERLADLLPGDRG